MKTKSWSEKSRELYLSGGSTRLGTSSLNTSNYDGRLVYFSKNSPGPTSMQGITLYGSSAKPKNNKLTIPSHSKAEPLDPAATKPQPTSKPKSPEAPLFNTNNLQPSQLTTATNYTKATLQKVDQASTKSAAVKRHLIDTSTNTKVTSNLGKNAASDASDYAALEKRAKEVMIKLQENDKFLIEHQNKVKEILNKDPTNVNISKILYGIAAVAIFYCIYKLYEKLNEYIEIEHIKRETDAGSILGALSSDEGNMDDYKDG